MRSEFIIFICFHLCAIIALSKECGREELGSEAESQRERKKDRKKVLGSIRIKPGRLSETESNINLWKQISLMIKRCDLFIKYDEVLD